ncbi:unnamed protein product [Moneuplotes crassus]|uniref:Calcineurin-like phosphoesterase domain-containing protein n=1 Tax=Euplotes crassus TaxID=5936 RepID=A0AAD1URX5_EUPCR|nr:unnamed protein product [Moneuplotes crassus]
MESSEKLLVGENLKDKTELKILHITDLHTDKHGMDKMLQFKEKVKEESIYYDIILISGDMQSYMMKDWEDPMICTKALQEITSILTYAHSICPNVYYIPGNHDPPDLFCCDDTPRPSLINLEPDMQTIQFQLKENCENIHGRIVEVCKGLKIAGFGGSKDNIIVEDGKDVDTIWEPYPYKDEEEFSTCLNALIKNLKKQQEEEDFQTILMTHIGPRSSESTIDREFCDNEIHMGSESIEDCMKDQEGKILCNIHGHSHESAKNTEVHSIPVINSNAFFLGQYGEIYFKKNSTTEKWELEDIKFKEF